MSFDSGFFNRLKRVFELILSPILSVGNVSFSNYVEYEKKGFAGFRNSCENIAIK